MAKFVSNIMTIMKTFKKENKTNTTMLKFKSPPYVRIVSVIMFMLLVMPRDSNLQATKLVNITGDFIIGAMFPIHSLEGGAQCGQGINDEDGIQNLESLLFSLKEANKQVLSEVGLQLGTLVFDTCYSDTVALERALQFVKLQKVSLDMDTNAYECADGSTPTTINSGQIIGVVGAATSAVSIQLASFLRLFKIPQISYSATSPELDDMSRYDYFMRTVSSDEYQAQAIVEILKTLHWTYVTMVYEDTSYGQMGAMKISEYADREGICIAESHQVRRYFSTIEEQDTQLKEVLEHLKQYNNTEGQTVVILFISQDIVEALFDLINTYDSTYNNFIWIAGDAWTGRHVKPSIRHVVKNAVGIQPMIQNIQAFDEYFTSLKPDGNKVNPWFSEYWEQMFNCSLLQKRGKKTRCTGSEKITSDTYNKNLNTYSVMDSVFAFAHGLKALQQAKCGTEKGQCGAFKKIQTDELMDYVLNASFTDMAGLKFRFYNNSGPARYSVMQYTSGYMWEPVGAFIGGSTANLTLFDKISFTNSYKSSVCSAPCQPGEAKSTRNKCCWTCLPCSPYQYLETSSDLCTDCPDGSLPNTEKTECIPIDETTMDFTNTWAIISIILSCCGLIATCFMGVVFFKNKETPIIMASGKELSFVLLVGIMLSYMSSFVFVSHPTPVACGTTRFLLGFIYSLCYAAILVKTNRIYRVFNIKTKKPKKVKCIDAQSQLLITFAIVLVEVVALLVWLALDPPTVTHVHPTKADNIRVCDDSKNFAYLGALAYPFVLMILCVVYAVKTRNTPDGFNETRFITFGSYSFCIMWIAFISIYFSVTNNTIRIVALSFASTVNATVTLITLFLTKVYVVVWRPQKNTRENVMSRRRTRSYETVEINNMSNLSRMASSVSTWHSVYPGRVGVGSMDAQLRPSDQQKFANKLSVSVVSMNNIDKTNTGSIQSISSAPPDHRRFTDSEILGMAFTPLPSKEDDLNAEKRKTNEIANALLDPNPEHKSEDTPNGTSQITHRRSFRSFRSRRKSRRTPSPRPRSADFSNTNAAPEIMVTSASNKTVSVQI